jgi:hypothetical protein
MKWASLLFALLFTTTQALACSCSFTAVDENTVREAEQVFVFKLVSARSVDDARVEQPWRDALVVAEIEVVEVLRGGPLHRRMHFSTAQCCGSRLDVGKYYAAFLPADEAEFFGHMGNLIEIGPGLGVKGRVDDLKSVLAGKRTLAQEFGEYPSDRITTVPRPPAPCPDQTAKTHR